jgi:hypothetical protein
MMNWGGRPMVKRMTNHHINQKQTTTGVLEGVSFKPNTTQVGVHENRHQLPWPSNFRTKLMQPTPTHLCGYGFKHAGTGQVTAATAPATRTNIKFWVLTAERK